jgi:hypothetical protein
MMVTVSGYAKKDMYALFEKELLDGNYENSCFTSVELLCSGSETNSFLGNMVNLISSHLHLVNGKVLEEVWSSMQEIMTLPSRGRLENKEFHCLLCKLIFYTMHILNKKQVNLLLKGNAIDMSSDLETYTYNESILHKFNKYCKMFKYLLDNESFRRLHVLLYAVSRNNLKLAYYTVARLLQAKELCTIPPVVYEQIEQLPLKARQDIVWVLWDVLCRYVRAKGSQDSVYIIQYLFDLFIIKYNKQNRVKRLNLVMKAYEVATKSIRIPYEDLDRVDLADVASKQIGTLFDDLIASTTQEQGPTNDTNEEDIYNDGLDNGGAYESMVSFTMPKPKGPRKKNTRRKTKTIQKSSQQEDEPMPIYLRVLPKVNS